MQKHLGKNSVRLAHPPSIIEGACVVGEKEGDGPLGRSFDYISSDAYFGAASWEKAESAMLKQAFDLVCEKAKLSSGKVDYVFAGDLLNQCVSTAYAMRESDLAYFGLYGACSTMAESLSLAAMTIDGGFANTVCAMTGSHFCSAERQFRFPLEYGGVRTPTAQWTVTGAGAILLQRDGPGPYVTHLTTGRIVDAGVTDMSNMGAAMAPAALDTLKTHFIDTGRKPSDYDAIVTGDLGLLGQDILRDLLAAEGFSLGENYMDCGSMIFDGSTQDTKSGGSGCGCSASVLAGYLLQEMRKGRWPRLLFCATGALMSPTSSQQGESIPGICHAVCLDMKKED